MSNDIKDEVTKAIQLKVSKALARSVNLSYMDTLRDRIVNRTQLGTGINPETGTSQKLKKLADVTKLARKGEARIWSTPTGGKIVVSANAQEKGIPNKVKKSRREAFKAMYGNVRLSSKTTPSKSNLTATGQMLKSLTTVKIKLKDGVAFRIKFSDRRGRDMWGESSKATNSEIAKYNADKGRHFFGFTKSQKNEIIKDIRQMIINFLK